VYESAGLKKKKKPTLKTIT